MQRSEMSDPVVVSENHLRTCSAQWVPQQQHEELESFVAMTMSQEMDQEGLLMVSDFPFFSWTWFLSDVYTGSMPMSLFEMEMF